jgi:hypothetical protein
LYCCCCRNKHLCFLCLLCLFCEFLEPRRYFTLKMDFDVCDGFIDPI